MSRHPHTVGMQYAFVSYLVYSVADVSIKALGPSLGVFEIGFFATAISLLPAMAAKPSTVSWRACVLPRENALLIHFVALVRTAAQLLAIFAFVSIPLADVYSVVFLIPLFVSILSVAFLRESVRMRRWLLLLLSLAGVLLVVRPGFRALEPGHLAAVLCALGVAVSNILMRKTSSRPGSQQSLFFLPTLYMAGIGFVLMLPDFRMPGPGTWVLLIVVGLCNGIGYMLQIAAFSRTPANIIIPLQYSQMLWAVMFGWMFFLELPDQTAMAGLLLLVCSGIFTLVEGRAGAVRA